MTDSSVHSKYELFSTVNNTGRFARSVTTRSMMLSVPFLKKRRDHKPSAVIAYAARTFGSLGDQAMFLVAMKNLRLAGYKTISLDVSERPSRSDLPLRPDWIIHSDHYFDGSIVESIRFQKELLVSNGLFLIGADVLDGYYSPKNSLKRIHLLHLATLFGMPVRVFGFSFNESPDPGVVTALRGLPETVELFARDPLSQRRLEKVLDRPILLVADLAFLLQPNSTGTSAIKALEWIELKRKQQGARVIGINANPLLALENFDDPYSVASGLAQTITKLHKTNPKLSFVLIPHDNRGSINDQMLNRITYEIASFNNLSLRNNMFLMPSSCSASEVKAVCAELDYAITGRMHLAIACLGQGTPVICIGYQGKIEGLFEHFDLKNMVITPRAAFIDNELVGLAEAMLVKAKDLRAKINKELPKVLSLAKRNFI